MESRICEVCGTENGAEYKYCKNCGNILESAQSVFEDKDAKQQVINNEPLENQKNSQFDTFGDQKNTYEENFEMPPQDFNGVSNEEMAVFIGKKADKILPKFIKMSVTGTKVSWCWPPAILGYFLGPLGCAIWFFFRKMYKTATIFAIIGAVLTIAISIMSAGSVQAYGNAVEGALNSIAEFDFDSLMDRVLTAEDSLTPTQKFLSAFSTALEEFVHVGAAVLSGLFALYWYKNHSVNKIIDYRRSIVDKRYYKMGLAATGGTSGGMLAVGIVIAFFAEEIAGYITEIILAVI